MALALLRLLAIIALLTMSIGMGGAPALAGPRHARAAGHCDEQSNVETASAHQKMDCMAACTAIPAESFAVITAIKAGTATAFSNSLPATGTEPEIATPPPRQG